MKFKNLIPFVMLFFIASFANAQIFYNNGALVHVNTAAIVQVNGDASNNGATGSLTNQGDVTITGNITNNTVAGGDGDFHVAGNWINNSTFNSGTGSVELNGALQQISGTQVTDFNDLLLTGTANKSLGIDARVGNLLALNDKELATDAHTMYIDNTATAAITRTTGFVSSLTGGTLSRATALALTYEFPTGSSVGTMRYRPVNITPTAAAAAIFTVRLANNDASTDGYNRTNIDSTICEANPNFYHMISRTAGTTAADVAINYTVSDGTWEGLANWNTTSTSWQNMGVVSVAGNYVTKAAWNTYTYQPYILTRRKADAQITAVTPICANNASITLTASEGGGTWAGTGITNATTGTFDPSVAGAGNHTITYTIAGTCGDDDNTTITVNQVASLSAVTTDESCSGAANGAINLTVTGGTAPYSFAWDNSATTEDLSPLAPGSYIVVVNDANDCAVTQTFNVLEGTGACQEESFYIPNIFSPNGDLVNDVFYVRGFGIKTLKLVIYDRWGEKIFEITDPTQGWDGTYRGKDMESAVFVYSVEAEMNSGTKYNSKGNITLVR